MAWPNNPRPAGSIAMLQDQVNAIAPNRSTSAEGAKVRGGMLGDTSHQARKSEHNPNKAGVVTAIDITHDPRNGMDVDKLIEQLIASKDERIMYIIRDRRIMSGTGQSHPAWKWRPYNGANPHTEHNHMSVKQDAAHYDDATPWKIEAQEPVADAPAQIDRPTLRRGSKGVDVSHLQSLLNITVDGRFGPATEAAVKGFQGAYGLVSDGIVGAYTWRKLLDAVRPPQPPAQEVIPVPLVPKTKTEPADRLRMAKDILDREARRDSKGHLTVYKLPAGDGGGRYEVAGINERYDKAMADKLVNLIQGGHYAEAEDAAVEYIAGNTDLAAQWAPSPAVESYLRDAIFNRGAGGAAKILQMALGVTVDGKVGDKTKAALALIPADEMILRLRAGSEKYEREVVGVTGSRAKFLKGLINRWNAALKTAQSFL